MPDAAASSAARRHLAPHRCLATLVRERLRSRILVQVDGGFRTGQGRLIPDDEIKASLARSHPYRAWLDRTQIVLEELGGTEFGFACSSCR